MRACGSARRCFGRRRRSTRTSEHGTLLRSRIWPMYAPLTIASVCGVCASCLLVCFTHSSSIRMPLAAADGACGVACFCRASLISRALLCALVRSRKISLGCPHPTATVAVHLDRRAPARTSARSIGPLDAACTVHRTDHRGSCGEGSVRACGSARRRLGGRWRSTRTSEHGTPLR